MRYQLVIADYEGGMKRLIHFLKIFRSNQRSINRGPNGKSHEVVNRKRIQYDHDIINVIKTIFLP